MREKDMRALVATRESQGMRRDDFDHCLEGELVYLQEPCGRDRRGDAESCGCGRAFAGMASHAATTTAVIRDLPALTHATYVETLRMSLADGGWPPAWAEGLTSGLEELLRDWPTGAVIERHLDLVRLRLDPITGSMLPPLRSRTVR